MNEQQNNGMAKLEKKVPEEMKKIFANLNELSKLNNSFGSNQPTSASDDDSQQNLWGIGLYK